MTFPSRQLGSWLLCACLIASDLGAQLVVARSLGPVATSTRHGEAERPRLRPWAEFQRAPAAPEDAVGWDYKLGIDLRLFDLPRGLSVSAELAHEMSATHVGELGFDPRGAVWSEGLALAMPSIGGWSAVLVAFARCRHDIDSGQSETTLSDEPGERVVVLMGSQLRITTPRLGTPNDRVTASAALHAEYYGQADDRRETLRGSGESWAASTGAVALSADAAAMLRARTQLYVRGWHSTMRFAATRDDLRSNYRIETGLRFSGSSSAMEVLVAREHTFDDLMHFTPTARSSTLVGLRFTPTSSHR